MWSDYYFYLMSLPEIERNRQITMLICFFIMMFIIGIALEFGKKNNKSVIKK